MGSCTCPRAGRSSAGRPSWRTSSWRCGLGAIAPAARLRSRPSSSAFRSSASAGTCAPARCQVARRRCWRSRAACLRNPACCFWTNHRLALRPRWWTRCSPRSRRSIGRGQRFCWSNRTRCARSQSLIVLTSSRPARSSLPVEAMTCSTIPRSAARIWGDKKRSPRSFDPGLFCCFVLLDGADAAGARALGARLDLEGHLLATAEAVEVAFGATPVEEEFLTVFGCDKAKATVRDQLLDGACRHFHLLSLELKAYSTRRACSRNGACGERRHCAGYKSITVWAGRHSPR